MLTEKINTLVPVVARKLLRNGTQIQKALVPGLAFRGISVTHSQSRGLTTKPLTKSIELISNSAQIQTAPGKPLRVLTSNGDSSRSGNEERPLTIIMSWLMSEKRHLLKYAHFYLDQGFDVLTVRATPWQLLWPVNGTQVIARDLITFMTQNPQYTSTMLHGFSVGGYMFGEVLAILDQDPVRYQPLIDRVVGQIWDSVVDFEGIPTGLPSAVFPNNAVLRASLEKYVRYHLAKFEDVATKHYLRASASYHNSIIKAPALFLCSLDDPVGNKEGIQKVIDNWERMRMTVYLKCWDSSPHVSHLHHHPEDYKKEMKAFLDKLGLLPFPEKFHHKQQVSSRSQ